MVLWNAEKFNCSSWWFMEGAVVVNGFWGRERVRCCIISVYALSLLEERLSLWERLISVVHQFEDYCICLGGDFNSVRYEDERSGTSNTINRRDIRAFDEFICEANLIDLPLHGRKYTWYRPNGRCKSRLDRFLVNNTWLANWPNSFQKGLPRSVSDHCPLSLEVTCIDWGPKPFMFINAWMEHPDFKECVLNSWRNADLHGWGGYVVKEKLKKLKVI